MNPAELVFPGFKFGLDDPDEALKLVELGVGGFCLYGGEVVEVARFTRTLQAKARTPLLFCADYEDGVASQCPGGTALSANMGLGAANSESLAYQKGAITAAESVALGVRWVFAPVVDLATEPKNPIVNTRSFSSDPATVTRLARAYIKGLHAGGALSCLKHFPGHGETIKDSHLELPILEVPRSTLSQRELVPFQNLAEEGDSVMTGHLSVPALEKDKDLPYSLSSDVEKTLRQKLGFKGLVCTDALNMQAVAGHFEETRAARLALMGGSDILLVPAKPRDLVAALFSAVEEDSRLAAAAAAACGRLVEVRERYAVGRSAAAERPRDSSGDALSLVGSPKNCEIARKMAEACLAWSAGPKPLTAGAQIRYWEPEEENPKDWLGKDFTKELAQAGARVSPVRPDQGAEPEDVLVVGSFLGPRAYTGRIVYGRGEIARIQSMLGRFPRARVVSFGSPFVFQTLKAAGLCAFSKNSPAQKAAAKALLGRVEVSGRMPF
ncbi:MAG: hypothetical protein HY921_10875 [Elusimicrobia bacterium]|nr:hypothetical protein [Elusimicrobiota bacterium]